jgi:predicted  nucleic acid-binding Zn-ribbon protein
MGAFEAEKKYKKNLEALKNEIEERNREIQSLKGDLKDSHDKYYRLENERKQLETRLVQ